MSVTFFLQSTEVCYPPCEACGARLDMPESERRERQGCAACYGYGADMVKNGPELNVANGNFVVLMDLLGLTIVDANGYCGDLEPEELRARVAVARAFVATGVRPTRRDGNMIECGLPAERIVRYLDTLAAICTLAVRRGEHVVWG